jgi:hypothetical protein
MKKLITSAGMVVLGATALKAQQVYAPAPGLTTTQLSKPWSVSAAVRGFYDDNYALTPKQGIPEIGPGGAVVGTIKPQSSWGWEVSPSAGLNWAMEQTYIGLSYVYDYRYFMDRHPHSDQTHEANLKLSHAFTDRYKLDIQDSFVSTRQPELVAPANAPALSASIGLRSKQDVMRNYGAATMSAGLTDQLSVVLGYSNTLYDFADKGPASLSALLNRMEHLASVNLRWQLQPSTVALIGYQFGVMDFTEEGSGQGGNADTGIVNPNNPTKDLLSEQRNSYSHYVYVGLDHNFNPQFDTSLRIGAEITEFYNLPGGSDDYISPYADANVTYHVTPDSWVQLGVRHSRIATDAAALDQENTTVYGSVNYRVVPPLVASLLGQFQYNTFQSGTTMVFSPTTFAGKSEKFYLVGLNLSYEFNKYLAAEAGYDYDRLDSDIAFRTFSRNRVYFGLRASY